MRTGRQRAGPARTAQFSMNGFETKLIVNWLKIHLSRDRPNKL